MSGTQAGGTWNTDGKWDTMRFTQKVAFLGKLVVALLTFGFVYPHILE